MTEALNAALEEVTTNIKSIPVTGQRQEELEERVEMEKEAVSPDSSLTSMSHAVNQELSDLRRKALSARKRIPNMTTTASPM